MKIEAVPGFLNPIDGRLRAGPFRGSVRGLRHRLISSGIRPGFDPDDKILASAHAQGVVLSCFGPNARGYFLDNDGIEASSSDLEAFLEALLPHRGPCRISGHYRIDMDRMIESDAMFWRGRYGIEGSERRELVAANGARRLIHARVLGPEPDISRVSVV